VRSRNIVADVGDVSGANQAAQFEQTAIGVTIPRSWDAPSPHCLHPRFLLVGHLATMPAVAPRLV
jgi:hypothetical protein